MNKFLRPDSTLVKHGSMLCTIPWVIGTAMIAGHDPVMAGFFLTGSTLGLIEGQRPSGVVDRNTVGFSGYVLMMSSGIARGQYGDVITSLGGMLSSTRAIADNIGQSRYAKKKNAAAEKAAVDALKTQPTYDVTVNHRPHFFARIGHAVTNGLDNFSKGLTTIVQKGAQLCRKSSSKKLRHFGDDMVEITQRPNFSASLIGTVFNMGFLGTGIYVGATTGDWRKAGTGLLWLTGWGMNGISIPQEGQKNIFVEWLQNGRDMFKKRDNGTGSSPYNGMKPE